MKSSLLFLYLLLLSGLGIAAAPLSMQEKLKAIVFDESLDINTRLQAAEQLCTSDPNNLKFLIKKGDLLLRAMNYDEACKLFSDLYIRYNEKCWPDADIKTYLDLLDNYSLALNYKNQYNTAVKITSELLKIKKPDSLMHYDFFAYSSLGQVAKFSKGNQYRKRIEEKMENILESIKKTGYANDKLLKDMEGCIHRFRVIMLSDEGRPRDKIAKEIEAMLTYATSAADTTAYYLQMALEYHRLDLNDEADKYYALILAQPDVNYNTSIGLANYINSLNDRKEYKKVVETASKYQYIIDQYGSHESVPYFWNAYAQSLRALGCHEEASEAYDKAFIGMYNLFQGSTSMVNESLANSELDIVLGEKESEKDISRQRGRWIVVLSLFLITAIVFGLIVRRKLNDSIKANTALRRDHNDEKEMFRMREKELTTLQMQLVSLNDTLQRVDDTLKDDHTDDHKKVSTVIRQIKEANIGDTTWEAFKQYFENASGGFIERLYAAHPSLTENDVRICAYILMNLTTKEIASLTHKSVRTIESIKYRLRKKLQLPDEQSTLAYLRGIHLARS